MRSVKTAVVCLGLVFFGLQVSVHAGTAESTTTRKETPKTFGSVSPAEAKDMIEKREGLLLIDVRSPQEYQQGALPGSTLMPFWEIMKGNHSLPKDKPILLVCAVGGRSLAVGQYLSLKGYREVYNLTGGLSEWARQRIPLPERQVSGPATN